MCIIAIMSAEPPSHDSLANRFEELALKREDPTGMRLYRALSWFRRARDEDATVSPFRNHAKCVFLWISFNAAYAVDEPRRPEHERYEAYLDRVMARDWRRIHIAMSRDLEAPILDLIDNEYVFHEFWQDPHSDSMWDRFEQDRDDVVKALRHGRHAEQVAPSELAAETTELLKRVFRRLYELRIQLMHGYATAGGRYNVRQVEVGARILDVLVAIFLDIMMDYPDGDYWGSVPYAFSYRNRSARVKRNARARLR